MRAPGFQYSAKEKYGGDQDVVVSAAACYERPVESSICFANSMLVIGPLVMHFVGERVSA